MRAFFLLLVLANLLYFAYAQVTRDDAGGRGRIVQLQVAPETVRLVRVGGAPRPDTGREAGKSIPPAPPAATAIVAPGACLEWGAFTGPAVTRAEAAIERLELPAGRIQRVLADAGGYWVHLPPLKSRAEVDRKVRELKDLRITEFFVVQDAGKWRNAISLGIFRSEDAARGFLDKLKAQGVRSAALARREDFLKQVVFYVREPDEATVARLTLLRQEFPESEIKATACPAEKG